MMNMKPINRDTAISLNLSYHEAGMLFGLFQLGKTMAAKTNQPSLEKELFALESRLMGAWQEVK